MEGVLSLLAGFNEDDGDFIDEVNLGNKHSCYKGTNNCPVFEVHIILDSLHCESGTQHIEVVQLQLRSIIDYIASLLKNLYSLLRNFSFFIKFPVYFIDVPRKSESNFF